MIYRLTIACLLSIATAGYCQDSEDIFSDWLEDTTLLNELTPLDSPEDSSSRRAISDSSEATAEPEEAPLLTPPAPLYSNSQMQLLSYTQSYNPRLTSHSILMNSAQRVADYHARTGRWGHSNRSSRPNASENIAWNSSRSISRISSQWKSSRGHNSNWLGNWKYVGVGVAYTSGRIYAVQHFANTPAEGTAVSLQSSRRTTYQRRGLPIFRLFRRR